MVQNEFTESPRSSPTGPVLDGSSAASLAARVDRIPTGRFHGKVASVLGAGTFFDGFDALSLALVLPLVIAAFGLDIADAGLLISAGYVGQWAGALIIGWWSDRVGRRTAFIVSLLVFGAFSLACAFAWNESSLLIFRLLQGLGLGAEVPVAGILISELLGRRSRGRITLIYQSLFFWGVFVVPLVALLAVSQVGPEQGWRVLFAIGALPILIAVWAWCALPESPRWLASKGRVAEAEAIVEEMEAAARGKALPEPETVVARTADRLRIGELFSSAYRGRTAMLAVVWFTGFFVIHGTSVWLPTMYVTIGGLPQPASLVLALIVSGLQLVVAYLIAWLVDRVGRRTLLITGFAVAAVGAVYGAITIGVLGLTNWQVIFSAGLLVATGITVPPMMLYLYTSELYPQRMRGWATSSISSINRVAHISAPFFFSFVLAGHGGGGAVFAGLAVASVIGLVVLRRSGIETTGRSLEELSQ